MYFIRSVAASTGRAWRSGSFGVAAWALAFGAYMAGFRLNSDTFWMARSGAEAWTLRAIGGVDRWSWDPVPSRYWPVSPGWELMLGGALSLGGPRTVQSVVALAMAMSVGALALATKRLGGYPGLTFVVLALFELVAPGTLEARAGFLALAWFAYSVVVVSSPQRTPRLPLPLHAFLTSLGMSALGVWMHASWCVLAFAIPFAVLTRKEIRQQTFQQRLTAIGAAFTGAGLGVVTTPVRGDIWAQSMRLREICKGIIGEWKSPLEVSLSWQVSGTALTLLLALLLFRNIRQVKLQRSTFNAQTVLLLSAVLSALAGWQSVRFFWQAALLATPSLTALASEHVRGFRSMTTPAPFSGRLDRGYLTTVLTLTAAILIPTTAGLAASKPLYPRPSIMAQLPVACNLLAGFYTSNLALVLRPDVRPWLDGRLQYWGRDRITIGLLYLTGQVPGEIVPNGTTCVIGTLEDGGNMDRRLATSKDWYIAAREDGVNLWLRRW